MKSFWLLAGLALGGTVFATDVHRSEGTEACVTAEIKRILGKVEKGKFKDLEIGQVDLGFWKTDDFEAKGPKGEKFAGYINTRTWSRGDRIHCEHNPSVGTIFGVFSSSFLLWDENDRTVAHLGKDLPYRGKGAKKKK